MGNETKTNIQSVIDKVRKEIEDYQAIIDADPTYDDEQELCATLANIERACFALRVLQSHAMSEAQAKGKAA